VNPQRITWNRVAIVALFSISCFLLLLLLWTSSGGPVPLSPKRYQAHVLLPQAKGLGPHSDVRVSGVTVGHVIRVEEAHPLRLGRSDVLIELEREYVPLRTDGRAMLRGKAILGEAYVALSLGSRGAPALPDGGTLAAGQARNAVEPDQIFETWDERTQHALRRWQQTEGPAIARHGDDMSSAFSSLRPWMVDAAGLLAVVEEQGAAVQSLLEDGGAVASGLADRAEAIQLLARSGNRAFAATGREGESLAEAFRRLPGFQREAARTVRDVAAFAHRRDTDLAVLRDELAPLSPAFEALAAAAPSLRAIVRRSPPLEAAGRRGLPDLERVLDALPPVLAALDPFLRSLNPALRYLADTRGELLHFIANLSAATQIATATPQGREPLHFLRAMPVLSPVALGPLSRRPGINRANPYPDPAAAAIAAQAPTFDTRNCANPTPQLSLEPSPNLDDAQRKKILDFAYGGDPANVPAPACRAAPPRPGFGVGFPVLRPDPPILP
jgi:phospholipid/cholesterol/gamma-HCH transport system substrate-binding protein